MKVLVILGDACHPYEPFKCPGDGTCISIQYLCDGAPDCQDGYDEDSRLCTAGELPFLLFLLLFNLNKLSQHVVKLIKLLKNKLYFCLSAKRPPVEETASFLQSLLASHGPNYLEKLFGSKARDALAPLGGVNMVAIALSGKSRQCICDLLLSQSRISVISPWGS